MRYVCLALVGSDPCDHPVHGLAQQRDNVAYAGYAHSCWLIVLCTSWLFEYFHC